MNGEFDRQAAGFCLLAGAVVAALVLWWDGRSVRRKQRKMELQYEIENALLRAQAPYKVPEPVEPERPKLKAVEDLAPPVIHNQLQRVFDVTRVITDDKGFITQVDVTLASTGETQFLVPKTEETP